MKILSFDIESTTGSHNDGSMCTFGYCLYDTELNTRKQEDLVISPKTRRMETKIKLHYDKKTIRSAPKFPERYEAIKSLFSSADLIIGFSVGNDVEFLNNACAVYNLKRITYEFLDVQLLYKTVFKTPTMQGLEKIAAALNVEYEAHRSDEDARVTLEVLEYILKSENLFIGELLRKYNVTLGVNGETEVEPCTDGVLSRREKNYLILDFVEKNYRHSRKYKGGLSFKTFAFGDDLRYDDIDLFRRYIKKIYELNGRVSSIDGANTLVLKSEITPKEQAQVDARGSKKLDIITLEEFENMLGDLPELTFDSDPELLKNHRRELKRNRELMRRAHRAEKATRPQNLAT